MIWNENALNQIPQKNGFRLRGLNMTRLETFLDAAFAFATTLLIISIGSIPKNAKNIPDNFDYRISYFVPLASASW